MASKERPDHPAERPEEPARRLPTLNEKPIVPRRRRFLRIGLVATGALFAFAAVGIRLLQHYEPGPQPVYAPPPTAESLASLAVKKGFPEQCLGDPYERPSATGAADPNVEDLDCVYQGHRNGQAVSDGVCRVTLERNVESDPYHFGFTVATPDDSQGIYIGKDSTFSDIPTTNGVPDACAQENVTYP